MRMRSIKLRIATNLGVLLLIARGVGGQAMLPNIPVDPFAALTGRFAVGTYDWLWVDASRAERFTKDSTAKRKLPVQVWYPAAEVPGQPRARYIQRLAEFAPTDQIKALERVETHAVVGAPVASADGKYPVLVYNHGAGWPRFSATFVTEQLASHGYVVFGVDHPGMDRTVSFSDGTTFTADAQLQPAPDPRADARAAVARSIAFLDGVAFPIWIEDSRFVLDQIEKLNRAPGPLQSRLDLDRIGMLGWSFGGAAAIEMLRTDPRVKAAVNHDGRLFGGAANEPIARPFMLMHHGGDDVAAAPEANRALVRDNVSQVHAIDSAARARATGDWYDVTIAKTNHGHFSDLPLFLALFSDTTLLSGRRDHEIITAYTIAFFDRYLKGTPSDLLARPAPALPEVAFFRRR
jgi:predicted dienelactone hydrolase